MKNLFYYLTVTLGLTGIVAVSLFTPAFNQETKTPQSIVIDGQTIDFTWTDDLTNETLHIYTDKPTYSNGVANATVYVAVQNASGLDQDIELMGYFRDSKQTINDVSVLNEVVRDVVETIPVEVCEESKDQKATSTITCYTKDTYSATTTVSELVWIPLEIVPRVPAEVTKEQQKLVDVTRKPVENFKAELKTEPFTVADGEVVYYKVNVKFPPNNDDNFYFEAVGSNKGYGHLDPWFNASWTYKVKLEVVPSKVGTTTAVSSFPVYVDLSDLPADFHSNVKSDGCDIRMVESDNTTETAFELVSYATSTDTGELYFMADTLGTTSTSTFYMYYGNSGASCYANTDTYGRNNVWSSYETVHHLQANSNDSTVNARNGTDTNITYGTAKIGNGAFNTSKNGKIATGSWSLTTAFSVTGWIKLDGTTTLDTYFSTYNGAGTGSQTAQGFASTGDGKPVYSNFAVDSSPTGATPLVANTWAKLDYTHDGTTARMYIDGVEVDTGGVAHITTTRVFNWMSRGDEATQRMDGYIDEVRVRNSQLAVAWLQTEYNNQSNTDTFYFVGAQETDGGGGGGATSTDSGITWFD